VNNSNLMHMKAVQQTNLFKKKAAMLAFENAIKAENSAKNQSLNLKNLDNQPFEDFT
jgi:hypothetical protein